MAVGRTSSTGLPWLVASSDLTNASDIIYPTSVAGSGVTVSGGQVSFSAATAVSVNGCFTAAYENYRLTFSGVSSVDGNSALRMRLAGTDNAASAYTYSNLTGVSGAAGSSQSVNQTSLQIALTNTEGFHAAIDVYLPAIASNTRLQSIGGKNTGTPFFAAYYAVHTVASAFDGLTLLPASGTITGTLRIYGLRNQ